MKKILIALVLIANVIVSHGENYSTTAKLPENKMIWPPVEFSEIENGFPISGKFIEAKSILVVDQGNWAEHTYLVKYKITKGHKKYPYNEILFISIRRWPARKSGIKMKALRPHFREGMMEFILKKDDQVRYMDFFNIMAYQNN